MIELSLDLNKSIKSFKNRVVVRQGDIGEKVLISIYDNKKPIDLTEQQKVKLEGNLKNGDYVEDEANPYNSEKGKYILRFQSKNVSIIGKYQRAFLRIYDENDNRISSEEVHIEVLKDADISRSQATTYVSKLDNLLENMDQEFDSFMDDKESDYAKIDQKCDELGSELTTIKNESTEIKKTQSDILQSIKDNELATKTELENAKQESSANVINQIGGAESAILKKELVVDGTEGTASRYVKDLPYENMIYNGMLDKANDGTYYTVNQAKLTMIRDSEKGFNYLKVESSSGTSTMDRGVSFMMGKDRSFPNVLGTTGTAGALVWTDDPNMVGKKANLCVAWGDSWQFIKKQTFTLPSEPTVIEVNFSVTGVNTKSRKLNVAVMDGEVATPLIYNATQPYVTTKTGEFYQFYPAPEDVGVVHGQPNRWNGTSITPAEKIITGWNDLYVSRSLSSLGLSVGDKVSFKLMIDNSKTPSGNGKARALLRCVDSGGTQLLLTATTLISEGSSGYSTCEITIPENTATLGIAKYAKDNGDTSKPATISVSEEKLIKGSLAAMDEYTLSQTDSGLTIINNGIVPFKDGEYAGLLSQEGVVRGETLIVGGRAAVDFEFTVIETLEERYPFIFESYESMADKIALLRNIIRESRLEYTTRIGGFGSRAVALFLYTPWNDTFSGIVADPNAEFKTFAKTDSRFKTQFTQYGTQRFRLSTNASSDGVTPTMIEIKDIRLTIELEVNGRTIIEEMIAANHVENIATQEEAESGTDNAKTMTPLRTAQQINKKAVTIAGNQTIGGIKNFKDGLMINDDLVVSKNDHSVFILDSTTSSVIAEGKLYFILHGSLVVVEGSIKFKTDVAYVAMISSSLPDSMIATINNGTLVGHIGNNSAKGIFVEKGTKNIKANSVFVANEWFTCNGVYWAGKE